MAKENPTKKDQESKKTKKDEEKTYEELLAELDSLIEEVSGSHQKGDDPDEHFVEKFKFLSSYKDYFSGKKEKRDNNRESVINHLKKRVRSYIDFLENKKIVENIDFFLKNKFLSLPEKNLENIKKTNSLIKSLKDKLDFKFNMELASILRGTPLFSTLSDESKENFAKISGKEISQIEEELEKLKSLDDKEKEKIAREKAKNIVFSQDNEIYKKYQDLLKERKKMNQVLYNLINLEKNEISKKKKQSLLRWFRKDENLLNELTGEESVTDLAIKKGKIILKELEEHSKYMKEWSDFVDLMMENKTHFGIDDIKKEINKYIREKRKEGEKYVGRLSSMINKSRLSKLLYGGQGEKRSISKDLQDLVLGEDKKKVEYAVGEVRKVIKDLIAKRKISFQEELTPWGVNGNRGYFMSTLKKIEKLVPILKYAYEIKNDGQSKKVLEKAEKSMEKARELRKFYEKVISKRFLSETKLPSKTKEKQNKTKKMEKKKVEKSKKEEGGEANSTKKQKKESPTENKVTKKTVRGKKRK